MDLNLKLSKRELKGKKAKQLIEEGAVLGNVFGSGLESQAVKGEYNDVNSVISEAGFNNPVDITIEGGKDQIALVHEVERDPVTQRLHHVSFQIIKKGEKIQTDAPVKLVGEAPAERTGKIVITIRDTIQIEAIPSKLPEYLEVSVDSLVEENDAVKVSDIKPIEGVEVLDDADLLVAKVTTPRAEVEDEDAEAEEVDPSDIPSDHGGDEAGENSEGDSKESEG